jgi:hypothetical protein
VSSARSASSGLHQSLYCQWYRPKGFSTQPPTPACRRVKIGRSEALSPVSCPAIPALTLAIRQLRVCAASATTNLEVRSSNLFGRAKFRPFRIKLRTPRLRRRHLSVRSLRRPAATGTRQHHRRTLIDRPCDRPMNADSVGSERVRTHPHHRASPPWWLVNDEPSFQIGFGEEICPQMGLSATER